MPVRDAKRRGEGWLAGLSDIGWSNSLGWYEGLRLLVAINPAGVITGLGFACASTKDQPLAETFFALGVEPNDTGWQGGGIGGPGTVCERQRLRRRGEPPTMARKLRGTHHLPAQRQRTQEEMAQATAALGSGHPSDFGDRLREAPQHLWPSPGASPRAERVAGTISGQGCTAQLVHLAQRVSRSSPADFCRLAGMVSSTHTKRLSVCGD
jgi:hypothetical protein